MALSDRIASKPKNLEGWFESLPERHRATIEGWLRDPNIPNAHIQEAIRADDPDDDFIGYRANKDTLARWRREYR